MSDQFALPLQGRAERRHLYEWIAAEEAYVADKFDDQRNGHDDTLAAYDLISFWIGQITQYLDRANAFLDAAKGARLADDSHSARHLEQRAQQAMAKCMMTAKGLVESSIRVYGELPAPGVSSGEVKTWKR